MKTRELKDLLLFQKYLEGFIRNRLGTSLMSTIVVVESQMVVIQ